MLNDDALPELRHHASIGTGDLAALRGTALTFDRAAGHRTAGRDAAVWCADSAAVHEQQRTDRRPQLLGC